MKIVLRQAVKGIGEAGAIKEVSDGYARNFLLPRGLAVPATEGMLKLVAQQHAAEEKRLAKIDEEHRSFAERLHGMTVVVKAKAGEQDRLYGSITSGDIAEAIKAQTGQEVDKKKIDLDEPIRHLGTHEVPIRLTGKVIPRVKVLVEPEE